MFSIAGGTTRGVITFLERHERDRLRDRWKKRDTPGWYITAGGRGRIRHVSEHFREVHTGRDVGVFVGLGRRSAATDRGDVIVDVRNGGRFLQVANGRVGGFLQPRLQLGVEIRREQTDAAGLGLEDALFQLGHER